jgi:tetratricopeptide (TPR) repeat protein
MISGITCANRRGLEGAKKFMLQDKVIDPEDDQYEIAKGRLELPVAPASEQEVVKAWEESVTMATYAPATPDRNPLFLEKRVYQGSSGRVYPLPVIDCIETEPRPKAWKAVHLENEFLRLMILPEIGGRIHVGLDKRTGYDFFYRQNVIKPALVGLAGPWISGGVEFNWPQHHRPATFMPVEVAIERSEDGSVTVWCSDHDPMARMKGMHGICLHPGKAYVEVRVRLYNRTLDTQTFLWWANVATHVHEKYQSFFPKDVRFAADHAKRATTEYPLSRSTYYGVPYGDRARDGVPKEQLPSKFVPDGSYPPNDLGWYANIPVPTSYMIVGSRGDFFGGYDHKKDAGTVAVANHHISPGKKQWTWGNHEFGYAWDRNLTESDGPYVELMSGVYTDNQPDFSFLAPGETKTFSQFWYPISEIGVPDLANLDAAVRVERSEREIRLHLQVTSARPQSTVFVRLGGRKIGCWIGDLDTKTPLNQSFMIEGATGELEIILEQDEMVLLHYAPEEIVPADSPSVATEPPLPEDVVSNDELFLNGLHLEQYRHPTRAPEIYWIEALRRDGGDSRCNHALGRWYMRRGEFVEAERYLHASIARLTLRNPNPYDGEPHYNLGLTLLYQERFEEAYEAFYKSTWNAAWRGPGYQRLAEIDCRRKKWRTALDHLDRSLIADGENLSARNFKALVLRHLGRREEAQRLLMETRAIDPLDIFSRFLTLDEVPQDGQRRLDLGFDLARAGFYPEAQEIFLGRQTQAGDGVSALLLYAEADVLHRLGREQESVDVYRDAATAEADYVFPSRLEELVLLEKALERSLDDANAPFYLGNLLYDRRRHKEAIALWERTTRLNPSFPTAWRNLGFAYFNVLHDTVLAIEAFECARRLAPEDARILYEQDQLMKHTALLPEKRLATLEEHRELVERRDDLSVELASLYNSLGRPECALTLLESRHFQPWEGGEGLVLTEYVRANVLLAQNALKKGDASSALTRLLAAGNPPHPLSEAKHLLMNLSMIDYWLGVTYEKLGNPEQAREHWNSAARQRGDFQQMQVQPVSEMTYWSVLALRNLGHDTDATGLAELTLQYALALDSQTPRIDYFATSLPAMLLFEESLKERQTITARFLEAQARLALGENKAARCLLEEVRRLDRSHTGVCDLLRTIEDGSCKCL